MARGLKVWLPGLNTWTTYIGKEGVYDWREVVRLEGLARKKRDRAPKCSVCRKALLCGQAGSHFSCRAVG